MTDKLTAELDIENALKITKLYADLSVKHEKTIIVSHVIQE
ncbi:hypothetical protein [Staphylothermus marinus]|nr:hypothetical protein [Staphylothermus marinus]